MKAIIFDSGPIISLTTNNLLWILEPLKKQFNGKFLMPMGVKRELIDRPLLTRKFKFEALQVQQQIESGIFEVIEDPEIITGAQELQRVANRILFAHNNPIQIIQIGEMETMAAALRYQADAIVVDERITRTLIEAPESLRDVMQRRLHVSLSVDEQKLHQFQQAVRHLSVLRSIELVTIAFERGLLDKYVVHIPDARRELLESILWGVKLNGCSVTEDEINQLVKHLAQS